MSAQQNLQIQFRRHDSRDAQKQAQSLLGGPMVERGFQHFRHGVEQVPLLGEKRSLVGVRARLAVYDLNATGGAIAGVKHGREPRVMVPISRRGGDRARMGDAGLGDVRELKRGREQGGDTIQQVGR